MGNLGSIDRFFAAADAYPAMPEIARQIVASVDDTAVGTATVVGIVEQDPRFAAEVLRFVRILRPETAPEGASLDDACAVWPLEPLRDIILLASIATAFPLRPAVGAAIDPTAGSTADPLSESFPESISDPIPDPIALWSHAAATGSYARWLSHYLQVDADSAYLAGILLRSGQILIAREMPQAVAQVEATWQEPGSRLILEEEMIGCRHTDVTAELGRRWQLPQRLIDGIRHASDPLAAQPFSDLAAVLHIASLLADGGARGLSPAATLLRPPPADREMPADAGISARTQAGVQAGVQPGTHLLDFLQLDATWLQTLAPCYPELADPVARWLATLPGADKTANPTANPTVNPK